MHGNGREWECKKPFPHISNSESTPIEQAGSASPHVGGSLSQIELGDALGPQAGSQRDEDVSQDGQALPSYIEASQVLATVYTEDFIPPPRMMAQRINYIHPMVTPPPLQLSHRELSLASGNVARNSDSILTLFSGNESSDDDVTFRGDSDIAYMFSQALATAAAAASAACPPSALHAAVRQHDSPAVRAVASR